MGIHARSSLCTAVVAASLLVAGCDGSPEETGQPPTAPSAGQSASSAPPRRAFDPPTRFDPAAAVRLPDEATAHTGPDTLLPSRGSGLPVVLYGTTLYIATKRSGLLRVDTTTGQVTDSVAPTGQPAGMVLYPPILAELDGVPTVLAPVTVTTPGSGTTPDSYAVEILAVAAEDGTKRWSFEIPTDRISPQVVGVSGNVLVLDGDGTVYGVDLTARKVVWQRKDFDPRMVIDGLVIGVALLDGAGIAKKAMALRASDGREQWSDADNSYEGMGISGGPSWVAITGRRYDDGRYYIRVVDTRTGKGDPQDSRAPVSVTCRFDAVSITVCSGYATWAFDVSDGETLWQLPDEKANRIAPEVTAVWHGAVYGSTAHGPLVLDARTGADREVSAGVAPILVNEYVGIATLRPQKGLFAIPAVA